MAKTDYITNGYFRLMVYQSDILSPNTSDPHVNVTVYLQAYSNGNLLTYPTDDVINFTSLSGSLLNGTYTYSGSVNDADNWSSGWKTIATVFYQKGIWSVSKTRTSFNVSLSGTCYIYPESGYMRTYSISLSGTVSMAAWPSSGTKDTMSVSSSMTMGTSYTISITHKTTGNKNTLTWKFGSQTGTLLSSSTSTSVSFTPATSLGSQIPSASSGTLTFTLTTYNSSGTLIGSTTYTSTLSVPSYSLTTPTVSAAKNTYTTIGAYVANKTQTRFTLSGLPSGSYGATVTGSYVIKLGTAQQTSGTKTGTSSSTVDYTASAAGTLQLTYTVKDSRGKTASASASVTYVANTAPTISFSAARSSSPTTSWSGTASGTYWNITGNSATVTFSTGSAGTNTASSGSFSRTVSGTGLAETSSLSVTATVTDSLGNTASKTVTITTVFAYIEATPNKVISIGRKATTSDSNKIQIGLPMECDDQIKLLSGSTEQTKIRNTASSSWYTGRYYASLISKVAPSTMGTYLPVTSVKAYSSDWSIGTLSNHLYFVNTTDSAYNNGRNYYLKYELEYADTSGGAQAYSILTTKNTADYVVSSGTSNGWVWRKWNSGMLETWKQFSVSIAVNSVWQQFCYGQFAPQSRPAGCQFSAEPHEYATIVGSNGWAVIGCGTTKPTGTSTGQYYLFRPAGSTASATTYNINIYNRGTAAT